VLILAVCGLTCVSCCAYETSAPPPESIDMLQDIFRKTADLLWEKSDEYFHDGKFEWSIAALRLVTEIDPTDVEAFSVGAWLMDSKGRPDDALSFLEKGLSINPMRWEMNSELGEFFYNKKRYSDSTAYFETAVKLPDCPLVVWHRLAHAYERSGRIEESIKTWEQLTVLEPDNPIVDMNLDRLKEIAAEQDADAEVGNEEDIEK
jgi:tetratricopeptide (TPR) repeat protein